MSTVPPPLPSESESPPTEAEIAATHRADSLAAREIIACRDILALFAKEISQTLAGEKLNAKLLYLIGTSRLFPRTMHAAIKGTSSGGKSELRKRLLAFFPPEEVISFTSMTEKTLIYFDGSFEHKILSMGEAAATEDQNFQDYLLRELISEGSIVHKVPMKVGKDIITQTIEKTGPVAFLVTTTRNALHPENETRLISLEIDDSEAQTRSIMEKVAQVEGLSLASTSIDYSPWHAFQRWLRDGERRVIVPFASDLGKLIPAKSVRLRRDWGQVLRAIKAHALLHREHRERDEGGQIIADIEHDYATVHALMNALVAQSSGVAVRPELQQTIEAVAAETANMPDDKGTSAQAIGARLRLDKSSARRRLLAAVNEGFITNLETRRGQAGRYRITGMKLEPAEMLPLPDSLPPCHRKGKTQVIEILGGCAGGGTVVSVATEATTTESEYEPGSFEPEDEYAQMPDFLRRRSGSIAA
jgi:hypothetical protein